MTLVLTAGVLLGIAWFGSLWLVVRHLPNASRPGLWLAGGALARFAAFLSALWALTAGHGPAVAVCLAGFIATRTAAVRLALAPDPPEA